MSKQNIIFNKRIACALLLQACFVRLLPAQEINVTIEFLQQVTLSARHDGFIQKFDARPGVPVFEGEPILKFDSRETDLELQQLAAEIKSLRTIAENDSTIEAAKARMRSSNETMAQLNQAAASTRIPMLETVRAQSSLDEAVAALNGARSEMKKARYDMNARQLSLKLVELKKQHLEILSPFDGSLVDIMQFEGNYVSKGAPIAAVYRLDKLAGVALMDTGLLAPQNAIGKQFRFQWDSKLDRSDHVLKIVRVSPRLDAAGTYRAYFEFDNTFQKKRNQWQLLPGMTVVAEPVNESEPISESE